MSFSTSRTVRAYYLAIGMFVFYRIKYKCNPVRENVVNAHLLIKVCKSCIFCLCLVLQTNRDTEDRDTSLLFLVHSSSECNMNESYSVYCRCKIAKLFCI